MLRRLAPLLALVLLEIPAAARAHPTDAVLDSLQYRGFLYFWNEANPANGLIKDRNTAGSPSSIAAVGFGLTSICIGIDHGWITRAQGQARVLTTLQTFWNGPQGPATSGTIGYKGFFYHFLDMNTALRMPVWNPELSDIDTALLLAGILDCRQYFNTADPTDVQIRDLATNIFNRVDWTFFQNASPVALRQQWRPENGGQFIGGYWTGYNEMMIMYLLAMGSPTFPLPPAGWNTYVSGYTWQTLYGQTYVPYGALFTHQYSHCWVDFRNKRDPFMNFVGSDYFTNSRSATLAQQAYCIANPGLKQMEAPNFPSNYPNPAGYSATLWGLTAGDDPPPGDGYRAHGAPGPGTFDNGTIAPTAVIGSLPFAPEICLPTIQNLWDNFPLLRGAYGLRDGFNLCLNPDWYATDFLGIDQGPIVIMIENFRNGSVWNRFKSDPVIVAGLAAAGFVSTVGVDEPPIAAQGLDLSIGPNPAREGATVHFRLPEGGPVRVSVHDVTGREVARLADEWRAAGEQALRLERGALPAGVYWVRLSASGRALERKVVLVR